MATELIRKTSNDLIDHIVAEACPLLIMPRHSEPPAMTEYGHRYILARNGLFLEVLAPAGHFRLNVGEFDHRIPYGECQQIISFSFHGCGNQHVTLINEFIDHARRELPNEAAAWLIWNLDTKTMRLQILQPDFASPTSITFVRPKMATNECLAIDIHSHAALPAFFSPTDDADDIGEVKLCMVVGSLDKEITVATRLCVMDIMINSSFDLGLL